MALSLRSPSLDVIQHPDPMEPGLSSDRLGVRPAASSYPAVCPMVLSHQGWLVKYWNNNGGAKIGIRYAADAVWQSVLFFDFLTQYFQLKPLLFCFIQALFVCCTLSGQFLIAIRVLCKKIHICQSGFSLCNSRP